MLEGVKPLLGIGLHMVEAVLDLLHVVVQLFNLSGNLLLLFLDGRHPLVIGSGSLRIRIGDTRAHGPLCILVAAVNSAIERLHLVFKLVETVEQLAGFVIRLRMGNRGCRANNKQGSCG